MSYDTTRQDRLERICAEKRHYTNKRLAVQRAAKLRKKYGHAVFAYKCPICHNWLHTSQPQSQADIHRAQRGQRAPIANPDHTIGITKEEPS